MSPRPDEDPALALLAARLTRMDTRLHTAETTLGEHDTAIGQAAGLADQVTRLSRLLTPSPAGGGGDDPERVYPRIWAVMDGAERIKALRYLARWVTKILFVTYPHVAAELPPCWPAHPAVVAELDWLCWVWEETWAGQTPLRASDAAWWHDRWLPGVQARIDPLMAKCKASTQHVAPDYRRPPHTGYTDPPPGTAAEDYWPELEFIEQMGHTVARAKLPVAATLQGVMATGHAAAGSRLASNGEACGEQHSAPGAPEVPR